MTLRLFCACLIYLGCAQAQDAAAQSLGHYHLPSTVPQFCGLGYGAGHHAPMIRPNDCHPPRQQRYVRVPGCSNCAMPMESFSGCRGDNHHPQLDQILRGNEHESFSVSPEPMPMTTDDSILPLPPMPPTSRHPRASDTTQPPQLEMLP